VNSIGSDFDEVLCDGYSGAVRAVQYLIGLGHKKIGYIGSTQQKYQVFNEHRYQGYLDALDQAGIKGNEDYVIDTLLTSSDGYASMLELIDRKTVPTAIFCGNDTVALGVMKALSERGFSVPDDISIIGFDNIEMAAYTHPAPHDDRRSDQRAWPPRRQDHARQTRNRPRLRHQGESPLHPDRARELQGAQLSSNAPCRQKSRRNPSKA